MVNLNNNEIRLSVRAWEKDANFSHFFWIRNQIIKRTDAVWVPDNFWAFFDAYRNGVGSNTRICRLGGHCHSINPFHTKPFNQVALMYGGGVESVYLDHTLQGVDRVVLNDFYYNNDPKYKREFEILLTGLYYGYSTIILGQEGAYEIAAPNNFEYTHDFARLWNSFFPTTTVLFPIGSMTKDLVYVAVRELGLINDVRQCELSNPPCRECWKCAERHFTEEALGYAPDLLTKAALKRYQRENQHYYETETDPFDTMEYLRRLERRYRYTGWRKP